LEMRRRDERIKVSSSKFEESIPGIRVAESVGFTTFVYYFSTWFFR